MAFLLIGLINLKIRAVMVLIFREKITVSVYSLLSTARKDVWTNTKASVMFKINNCEDALCFSTLQRDFYPHKTNLSQRVRYKLILKSGLSRYYIGVEKSHREGDKLIPRLVRLLVQFRIYLFYRVTLSHG